MSDITRKHWWAIPEKARSRTRGRSRFRPAPMELEGRRLLSFTPTVLAQPSAFPTDSLLGQLTIDGQDNLYGTTQNSTQGTVFKIDAGTSTVTTLATFDLALQNGLGGLNGRLLLDGQGNLYGTTQNGGDSGDGTVFEIPAGTTTVNTLASFDGSNGSSPRGGLVRDSQGNLFGTTAFGGANGDGTVFELASGAATITTLVSFNGSDGSTQPFVGDGNGANPAGGLVMDSQGNLFGTTPGGGLTAGPIHGTLFVLLKADNYGLQTLHVFGTLPPDGASPAPGLLIDTSRSQPGYLYGTTFFGGSATFGRGEVFVYDLSRLGTPDPTSGFSNAYQFGETDGFGPEVDMAIDTASDTIYGTTNLSTIVVGGATTVTVPTTAFALHVPDAPLSASSYSTTRLVTFPNETVGGNVIPGTALVRDSQGNLYGTTSQFSGTGFLGSVFELKASFQATAGSIASSTDTAVYGQPVTFTATFSPAPTNGETVTFLDGTSPVMSVVSTVPPQPLLSGGQAQLTASLDLGAHAISTVYAGDGVESTGSTTSQVSVTVLPDPTTTVLTTPAIPVESGKPVSFTATVSPGGLGVLTPSGLVQFTVDNTPLGAPAALSGGQAASPSTSTLAPGWHAVAATFTDASGHFLGSTALQPLKVEDHTATSLSASTTSAAFGTPVTFTATVTKLDHGLATVTGTVSFYDGSTLLSTVAVSGGQAALTTSALAVASTPHLIVAEYNGATFVAGSFNAVTVTVTPATTTISWANPAGIVYGTALGGAQLDATTGVPGTFTYTPAAGTVLGAGNNQTLSVVFTPADTTHYTTASATVHINVGQATPTLVVSGTTAVYDGNPHPATFAITGVNGDNLTSLVTLTYNGSAAVPVIAGTYAVTASFPGTANYGAVTDTSRQVVILASGVSVQGTTLHVVGAGTSDTVTINPAGPKGDGSTGLKIVSTLNGVKNTTTLTQPFTAIVIAGAGGDDKIQLAAGLTLPTTITAGDGNNTIQLGGGNDVVTLGTGSNQVTGGNGNKTITASDAAGTKSHIALGNGNNNVTLGNGNDTIELGDGSNVIVEGSGNDSVTAGNGANLVVGGLGQHTIQLGKGNNILIDGAATVVDPADSFRQILGDWNSSPSATVNTRLKVVYNTSHPNVLKAGGGRDWFFFMYSKDSANPKKSDRVN